MRGNLFKPPEKAISRGDRLCPPPPRQGRVLVVCFVDYDACANLRKRLVACGFSWLLRVIDHEAVPMEPKLFSSWVHRSLVLLKRGFGRQTSSRWRFSRKNDWVVQVIPQQAIKAIRVLSTRKTKNGAPAAEAAGMALFTTALGLYGGVLCCSCGVWSGELQ
jgi:hypothetical protein